MRPSSDKVQTQRDQGSSRIETKGASGSEGSQQLGEGQRKDGSPEQVGRDGESHTNLSVREGEDLGGVSERDRTFTRRVEGSEQEDEEGDKTGVGGA